MKIANKNSKSTRLTNELNHIKSKSMKLKSELIQNCVGQVELKNWYWPITRVRRIYQSIPRGYLFWTYERVMIKKTPNRISSTTVSPWDESTGLREIHAYGRPPSTRDVIKTNCRRPYCTQMMAGPCVSRRIGSIEKLKARKSEGRGGTCNSSSTEAAAGRDRVGDRHRCTMTIISLRRFGVTTTAPRLRLNRTRRFDGSPFEGFRRTSKYRRAVAIVDKTILYTVERHRCSRSTVRGTTVGCRYRSNRFRGGSVIVIIGRRKRYIVRSSREVRTIRVNVGPRAKLFHVPAGLGAVVNGKTVRESRCFSQFYRPARARTRDHFRPPWRWNRNPILLKVLGAAVAEIRLVDALVCAAHFVLRKQYVAFVRFTMRRHVRSTRFKTISGDAIGSRASK